MTLKEEKKYSAEIGRHLAETIKGIVAIEGHLASTIAKHTTLKAFDEALTNRKQERLVEEKKRVVATAFARDVKIPRSKL